MSVGTPTVNDTELIAQQLYTLMDEVDALRAVLAKTRADAERYRWLKAQKGLDLHSDHMVWVREDGSKFSTTHYLAAGDTQYAPYPSLDETVDEAMKLSNSRRDKIDFDRIEEPQHG